jgi:hypothetical protein
MALHGHDKLPPTELRDARIQLHWAAQVLSAAADRWLQALPDDGHTNMAWSSDAGALIGNAVASGLQLALAVRDFELRAVLGSRTVAALALTGQTLAEAMRWADAQLAGAEGGPARGIQARDYDMPEHPVRGGAAFSPDPLALAELAGWFAHGDAVLRKIAAGTERTLPVRVWPHHFDAGSIRYLAEPGPSSPQIGFGLSPGDRYYEQPYFYVTAFPLRPDPQFPALPDGGFWREHEPFVGAVLLGSAIAAATDPHAASRRFLESAIAAGHALTGQAAR